MAAPVPPTALFPPLPPSNPSNRSLHREFAQGVHFVCFDSSRRPGKQLPLLEFGPRPPASQSLSTPILLFYSQSLCRGILVSGRPLLRAVLIVDSSGASCYRAAQFHSVRPQVFHLVALCEAVIPFHEADSIHSHKLLPLFGFIIFA